MCFHLSGFHSGYLFLTHTHVLSRDLVSIFGSLRRLRREGGKAPGGNEFQGGDFSPKRSVDRNLNDSDVQSRGVFLPPFARTWAPPLKRSPSLRGGRSILQQRWQQDRTRRAIGSCRVPKARSGRRSDGSETPSKTRRKRVSLLDTP